MPMIIPEQIECETARDFENFETDFPKKQQNAKIAHWPFHGSFRVAHILFYNILD